jgi:hypothetical protein
MIQYQQGYRGGGGYPVPAYQYAQQLAQTQVCITCITIIDTIIDTIILHIHTNDAYLFDT